MTSLGPLVFVTLILQQSPASPTTTPSSPVYRESQGVTSPVLVHEAKPNYTAAALRARIQGTVLVECVVMPDGSVGDVSVLRSLDPQFGLDEEAMKTVKQWRFRPGMKDGAPVPVLVLVELSFTLKDSPDNVTPGARPAGLRWPDAFFTSPPSNTTSVRGTFHHPSVDVTYSYPSTWSSVESNAGITLYTEDANGTRAVTISSPQPASFSLKEPLTQSALDSSALAMQAGAAFSTNLRVVKSGQVLRVGGPWIWFEMTAPSVAAWNAPPALADHLRSGYSGLHVWSFATTAAGQIVNVSCTVVHRAGLSDADQQQQIRVAAHECGAIVTGISFPAR
jgi:TonB family protein